MCRIFFSVVFPIKTEIGFLLEKKLGKFTFEGDIQCNPQPYASSFEKKNSELKACFKVCLSEMLVSHIAWNFLNSLLFFGFRNLYTKWEWIFFICQSWVNFIWKTLQHLYVYFHILPCPTSFRTNLSSPPFSTHHDSLSIQSVSVRCTWKSICCLHCLPLWMGEGKEMKKANLFNSAHFLIPSERNTFVWTVIMELMAHVMMFSGCWNGTLRAHTDTHTSLPIVSQ